MEDEALEDQINPLVIPRVLHQILDFLTIAQLKNCRRVNNQFCQEICSLLRKKDICVFNCLNEVANFTSVYSSTKNFPYKSFIFSSELLRSLLKKYSSTDLAKNTLLFENFCIFFGCYVTNAHFNLDSSTDQKNNDNLIRLFRQILLEKFPNLESLSLLLKNGAYRNVFELEDKTLPKISNFCINVSGYEPENKFDTTFFIRSILERCSNLEVISCKLPSVNNNRNENEQISILQPNKKLSRGILANILSIDRNHYIKNLSEIEILIKLSEQELQSLGKQGFKLRRCYLELDESICSESLGQFICKQKYQLEFLYLEFPLQFNSSSSINIDLVCVIPHLKTLSLQNYIGSLRFLKECPCLEEVILNNVDLTDVERQDCVSSGLMSFKIYFKKRNLRDFPKSLRNWFPNLTILFLSNTDNETIRSVFDNLNSLRDVTFIGSEITDGGICGESDKILKLLIESMAKDIHSKASVDHWDYQPRYPSICDLKHLQYCQIQSNFISDASIVFGLALCKGLKKLHLFSRLELITTFGVKLLSELQNLNQVNIFIRNVGWTNLDELRILANKQDYRIK